VATYETELVVPRPIEETFAFVSDFRNAVRWDPRTYFVTKTTEGPIGTGTRFMLTGGLLRQDTLKRLHLSESVIGMPLPYDVVSFDAPNEFVLEGESRFLRYRDRLTFSAQGSSTRLVYYAELEMKSPLTFMDRLVRGIFTRIGDDATADLPATVAEGT
jgi:hypothetical protein